MLFDRQQIQLILQAQNLKDTDIFSKSDSFCQVSILQNNKITALGKTQVRKNELNPKWSTSIKLDYIFEQQQKIFFKIWDFDSTTKNDLLGQTQCLVSQLVHSFNKKVNFKLKPKGSLLVYVQKKNKQNKKQLNMQWRGHKIKNVDSWFDFINKSDPFLRFFKNRENSWMLAYQSPFLKNNQQPVWPPFVISSTKLANDQSDPIKIQCWDDQKSGKHQYIGTVMITIKQISQGQKKFELKDKSNKFAGFLQLIFFQTETQYSFLDFLQQGQQINTVFLFNQIIAIDFTGSNLSPQDPQSLHNIYKQPNQYQKAIYSIMQILLPYDFDKKIPVYGFGAKLKLSNLYNTQINNCFALNGNENNPQVFGLEEVMNVYINILPKLLFSGPTLFEPIIVKASQIANLNKKSNIYTILLIITDGIFSLSGQIHDMKNVQFLLQKYKYIPLSIIIIGVGNQSFSKMKQLDNQNGARDIVQFVEFKKCIQFLLDVNNMNLLASEVLRQLPDQLVQYKRLMKLKPGQMLN